MKQILISIVTLMVTIVTFIVGLLFIVPLGVIALLTGRAVLASKFKNTRRSEHDVIEGEYQDVTDQHQASMQR